MNEKNILNERKSKIALILVLTILMQIFMPIFTGTSKVYAATNVEKENVICAQYSYMDADCDFNSQPTEIIDITLSDAQAFGNAVSCPTTYWVIVYAKDGDNIKWTSNGKTGEQTSKRVNSSIGAYYNLYAGDVFSFSFDPMKEVTFYISKGLKVVTSSVTLETNGGKINSGNITTYDEGTGATLPTDVTKDGYTFEGWFASSDFSGGAVTEISTTEKGDKKYWAKWTSVETTEELLTTITATGKEQASYSVENVASVSFSYTTNGSSAYFNNGKTNWGWWGYGWTATVTPADGYTITKCVFYDDKDRTATDSEAPFVVETTEEDKTPKVNGTPILANQSKGITKIEVYGYVQSKTATITLNTNGGTIKSEEEITEYTEGTGATLPTNVTKEGYIFLGWYDNENLTGSAVTSISTTDTGDKTFYAKWVENLVGNIYKDNIAINYWIKIKDKNNDTAILNAGTHSFTIEKRTSDNEFLVRINGNKLYISGDITKDAIGIEIKGGSGTNADPYTLGIAYPTKSSVTLNTNGGTINSGNITEYTEGTGATLPTDVTKEDHSFGGWYNNSSLTGSAITTISTTETGNKEYWAKWNENPSITELSFTGYNDIYNGNTHGVIVTGDTTNYTIRYSIDGENYNLSETPTYINVGNNTVYYKVTREGYKELTGSVEINISNATITDSMINFEDVATTYDGDTHQIKQSGSGLPGATITYSIDGTNYTGVMPTYTDVGTYTVQYKVTKPNYKEKTGSAKVTITASAITVKAKDKTITYGDETPIFDYEITSGSLATGDTLSNINVSQLTNTDVGTYDITVSQTEGSNPNYAITFVKGTFRIDLKEITPEVTLNQNTFTYNGEDQKPTVTVKYNENDLPTSEYSVDFTADSTNVGNKQVVVSATNGNYIFNDITKNYTINPKAIDSSMVTIADSQYVFNNANRTPVVTVKDGTKQLVKDTDYEILETSTTTAKDVGNYNIIVKGKGNYAEEYTIPWSITKAQITASVNGVNTTYDGQEHKIDATIPTNATIKYKTNVDDEYTNTNPAFKNVGNYTVYYKIEIDNNYDVVENSETVIITPKAVTVTPDNKSKVYGEDDTALTYTATGLIGSEALKGITLAREVGEEAGIYTITASKDTSKDQNYNITLETGTFTINKKEVTSPEITVTTENIVYTGNELKPAIVVKDTDGNVIPETEYEVSYSNNVNSGTNATITLTNKTGGNYVVSGEKTFTINPKEVNSAIVEYNPTENTYAGSELKPVVTVKDTNNTVIDSSEYTVEYSNNTNAGTATIIITDKDGGNYIVSGTTTFEIKKKEINGTITLKDESTNVYTGEEIKPEIIVKDSKNAVVSEDLYKVTYSNNINSGTANISIESKNNNYIITGTTTFKIAKANITTISFADNTVTYDGAEHSITLNGSVAGGNVEYSTDGTNYTDTLPTYTNVGEYTVYYKVTKLNYNDLTGNCKITINRKEITKENSTLESVNKEIVYTGEEIKPSVVLKLGDTIIPETEYTVDYEDNIELGTATIKVTDSVNGNYAIAETLTTTFEIIDKGVVELVNPDTPNANNAKIVGTAEELTSKIKFTPEELEAKENGKDIDIYLEVTDISNSVLESDKKAIESKLENRALGLYLDISLFKKVAGQTATKVTETQQPITISFEIPENLVNTNPSITRTYKILRLHNGVVTTLDVTVNGRTATFMTDEFSTYALIYSDGGNVTTVASASNANAGSVAGTTSSTTLNPKTGDNITVYVVMFIISTIGMIVLSTNKGLKVKKSK